MTPGWYTGYAGVFYDLYLPKEEQSTIVMADLSRRLGEMAADPMAALLFFKEKILSQWMEPTYSTIWWGTRCDDLAIAYMNICQQALYVLACVGTAGLFKKRRDAAAMALPVIVIGGFLFHTLMEAKSQYIYPYMVYMTPLSALGLSMLGRAAGSAVRPLMKKEEPGRRTGYAETDGAGARMA